MKYLVLILLYWLVCQSAFAQNGDFEVKVVSNKFATVKGQLKKATAEGIAVREYKGNYFIFRPNEIKRIKVRRRGLTVIEGMGTGALTGLGIGALIWSIDENGYTSSNMLETTAALTVCGAVAGAISGVFSEIVNTKLIISVNNDEKKFNASYHKLDKYVNHVYLEHVN